MRSNKYRWVTITEDWGDNKCGRDRDGHAYLMQPEAQTTMRGSLAVSAGTLEIAIVMQGALEAFWLHDLYLFTFIVINVRKNRDMFFAIALWFFLKLIQAVTTINGDNRPTPWWPPSTLLRYILSGWHSWWQLSGIPGDILSVSMQYLILSILRCICKTARNSWKTYPLG